MKVRHFTATLFVSSLLLGTALAAPAPTAPAPAAPAAPAAAPPAGAPQQDPNLELSQSVGDWTLRCFKVKSPAPCEIQQIAVSQQTNQRAMMISIAYVPSRDRYPLQIVVPTGVALSKGMILGAGSSLPNTPLKYTRCERDGCYVELLIDTPTITTLSNAGKTTQVAITAYGKTDQIKLPVSLTGFAEAVDRLKSFSRDRAIALPPEQGAPGAAPAADAAAPAPAKATAKKGK